MPKLTKTNLARGAKLSSQHIENNLDPISEVFNDTFLDTKNLEATKVPFYANFTFAGFEKFALGYGDADEPTNGISNNLVVPIPLIPTQDHFSNQGNLTTETPIYVLDSVSVSMDLRAEGAAMKYTFAVPPFPTPRSKNWKIDYEDAATQNIDIALLQKDYTYFADQSDYPTNTIFTTQVPATIAFAGSESRVENPYYVFGINKQINPYKSYYLSFAVPEQRTEQFYISNLVISFKFYTILDTNNENVDNTINKSAENSTSAITNYNLNLLSPAPYSVISADDATGLQTNLQKIDLAVEEKLTTGYGDKYGTLGSYEENSIFTNQAIKTPASYDIIVVPMWQGTYGTTGLMTTFAGGTAPYSDVLQGPINPNYYEPEDQSQYTGPIQDIRTIPLFYPFTIHHILAFHNEQARTGLQLKNFGFGTNSGVIQGAIGVGLGSCFQADLYTYEQIGYLTYQNNFANVVDEIRLRDNVFNRVGDFSNSIPQRAGTLMQVPLTNSSPNGVGFYPQGFPFYCAGGTERMEVRSEAPDTQGMENFIEIRWEFTTEESWFDDIDAIPPQYPQVIAGLGGHFVYLIGKKLLTTNRNNLQE